MCLVAFQKIFRKIFSGVWKRRRKTQIQKKSSTIAISPARSRDQRRRRDLAIDGAGKIAIDASRTTLREIAPSIAISVEGKIAINCAISRRRDLAKVRSRRRSRSSRSRTGAREISAAWSSKSASDHRTDWNVLLLSRARALSLFFRKCFEVKMKAEIHFRGQG